MANGYWRGEGTSNTIPRPVRIGVHTGYDYDYNVQTSTRYLEDASYFKLKTVTLGYTLPESVVKKLRVNSLRVYVSADNLLTLTKYSGYDPEHHFPVARETQIMELTSDCNLYCEHLFLV